MIHYDQVSKCNGEAIAGGAHTVLPARSGGQYLYTDLAMMFFTGNGPLRNHTIYCEKQDFCPKEFFKTPLISYLLTSDENHCCDCGYPPAQIQSLLELSVIGMMK